MHEETSLASERIVLNKNPSQVLTWPDIKLPSVLREASSSLIWPNFTKNMFPAHLQDIPTDHFIRSEIHAPFIDVSEVNQIRKLEHLGVLQTVKCLVRMMKGTN